MYIVEIIDKYKSGYVRRRENNILNPIVIAFAGGRITDIRRNNIVGSYIGNDLAFIEYINNCDFELCDKHGKILIRG